MADKRMLENKRVKDSIALAFFSLLRECKEEDITVTEIVNMAQVSRMAYYRNFDSKIEIIKYYINETIWSELNALLGENIEWLSGEFNTHFFHIMKKYRDIIILLNNRGYASIILNAFNEKNEELAGDMPATSVDRYKLYCAAGAGFNVALMWLRGGCRESEEELVGSLRLLIQACAVS